MKKLKRIGISLVLLGLLSVNLQADLIVELPEVKKSSNTTITEEQRSDMYWKNSGFSDEKRKEIMLDNERRMKFMEDNNIKNPTMDDLKKMNIHIKEMKLKDLKKEKYGLRGTKIYLEKK